jgi:hypothetical protein
MKKTILEEALADAKVLKAMALEQAKITIAESMTPAIEAALSSQLKKDLLEGDEYEDESAQPEDEAKDGKSVMEAISKLGLDETTLAAISKALGENKKAPATDDEEEEGDEEEETNESFDLDAALAEIESKETEEDRAAVKEEAEADDEEENMDESLDIDAILAEMDDDSDDTLEDGDEEGEGDDEENEDLSDAGKEGEDTSKPEENEDDELDEAALFEKFKAFVKGEKVASSKVPASKFKEKGASIASEATINESATVKELRNELKDLNVLAAKLLYQNKTILATNLTESQKAKVIVAFDKVKTVDEAKLIFETLSVKNTTKTTKRKPLAESLGFISLGKKTITESAQPSGTQYTEEQKLMMKRAGIKI